MRAYVSVYEGEDGWWIAEVLNMRGCITQAKTREAALERIREAMKGWLDEMRESDPAELDRLQLVEVEELEIAA
jgi:predicted RNase H-like HicB family nuclease